MSYLKAKEYLKKFNKENDIITFPGSSHTVYEASVQLNCDEDSIAKSLAFMINDKPTIIITSGKAKIDNHKFKEEFKVKASMIKYDEVEKLIGHAPGGVCPFGVNDNVDIYFDESLKKHSYIYPAAGEENNAIKLNVDELERIVNYIKYVNVTKDEF